MSQTATTQLRGARRSGEDRIPGLGAQMEVLKRRTARKPEHRDPALRHVKAGIHAIDKAPTASNHHANRQALGEARSTVDGMTPAGGSGTHNPRPRRSSSLTALVAEEALLTHARSNQGQRSEQVAQALGTDSDRPAKKPPIQDRRVKTAG